MSTTRPLEDVLFVAVETVPQTASLQELPSRLQLAWQHKAKVLLSEDDNKGSHDLYCEQGGLYAEFGKVITITVAYFHKHEPENELELRVKTISAADDEKSMLETFKNLLNERFDPNRLRLCAHNGKEFDFPFLCRRMLVHCIPIPSALSFAGKKPWEVPHLDTMEMWMFGNRKYYASLESLAALFDIPVKEPFLQGAEVSQVFYEEQDMEKIIRRGQQQVITTAQLYMRYRCSPLLAESQISLL